MLRSGFGNYWYSGNGALQNWLNLIPNISILGIVSILWFTKLCPGLWLYGANGISFFLLSLRSIYFFGFFRETSKFNKILGAVAGKLKTFIVVLVLLCFMFVVPFMMLDKGNRKMRTDAEELQEEAVGSDMFPNTVDNPSDMVLPIIHLYMVAIGGYDMIEGFKGNDSTNYYAAIIIFFFVTFIIQMVMMNLIISIIEEVYTSVNENINQSVYAVRANNVIENMHLVPQSTIDEELAKGRWLVTEEKFDFDKAELKGWYDSMAEEQKNKENLIKEQEALLESEEYTELKEKIDAINDCDKAI